jgi:hypothetical protein
MRSIPFRKILTPALILATLTAGTCLFQQITFAFNIANLAPDAGPIAGGQEITITGDFAYNPMQQMTPEYCANGMSIYPTNDEKPDTITLTDIRDNQDYRVRKLADGKCWMIDNLKLELTNGMTLTPSDTNIAADTTVYFTEDNTENGTALGGMTGNFTTSGYNTRNGTGSSAASNYDVWRQNDPSDIANCLNNTTGSGKVSYNPNSETGCGYLYNFYTATAGTAPQSQSARYSTASGSICPAGWKLPTGLLAAGDTTNDFGAVDKAYGGTGSNQSNTPPVLTDLWLTTGAWQGSFGGVYINPFSHQGGVGNYWSSSIVSATNAYVMGYSGGYIYPGNGSEYRYNGFAVRCLAAENYTPAPAAPTTPAVTIGGEPAAITDWSDTFITFIAPARSAGKADITVTRGPKTFTLTEAYEYLASPAQPEEPITPDTPNTPSAPNVPNTGLFGFEKETATSIFGIITATAAVVIIAILIIVRQLLKTKIIKINGPKF